MRRFFAAALLLCAMPAIADDAPRPLVISINPLGDRDAGVVAELIFIFANPRQVTEAGLFIEGSITEQGRVPRNFRFAVPRKGDKLVWNNYRTRNGRILRHTRWSLLPDQRNEMAMVHTFSPGEAVVDVRLVLEGDYGKGSQLIADAAETFTIAKTNKAIEFESEEDRDAVEKDKGPVSIREPRFNAASNLHRIEVDVEPQVKRVEFLVNGKKVLARRAPPFAAELELGENATVRAIGYDANGSVVAEDSVVVNAKPF
jgi:hypothetical protein